MDNEINSKDYLWIVTETKTGQEENMVGLGEEQGQPFIPATENRDDAVAMMSRLPACVEGQRQVEAIHKQRLLEEAKEQGFSVLLVDGAGKMLGKLDKEGIQ